MTQVVLHHYPMSPFAEKVRLILGFKKLPWSSVHIPSIMPKPDVMALTGGYRKTPILQIGADVYCDTALIAEELEARQASPSLYPPGIAAASRTLAQWADSTLFWAMIPFTMQPAGLASIFEGLSPEAVKAFADDRAVFRANLSRMRVPDAVAAFTIYLQRLAETLGPQPYFFGAAPSIADFSIYHNFWYVLRGGPVAKIFDDYPALAEFRERMRALGHGESQKLDSAAAGPNRARCQTRAQHGNCSRRARIGAGRCRGGGRDRYRCRSDRRHFVCVEREIGFPSRGTTPAPGEVVVHFPRLGFELRRLK